MSATKMRHGLGELQSAYLDMVRALAANLVIFSHVSFLYFGIGTPFGALGVTVFFLLSGFLITQSLMNSLGRPGPRFPRFVADRVARVMTPYVPVLVLVALANYLLIDANFAIGPGHNAGVLAFLGNLFLLQDHSVFQLFEVVGRDLSWRFRPYNTAEPFWTVAIEMWIYIAIGLFVLGLLGRERIPPVWAVPLLAISLPVIVWNAAAGGGKALTLIWLLGAVSAYLFRQALVHHYPLRTIGGVILSLSAIALAGHIRKVGFDPYELQCATLMALGIFGLLAFLPSGWNAPLAFKLPARLLASYSYSLYLVHNTVLIVVLRNVETQSIWTKVLLGVLLAHLCAYLNYLAFERHYRAVSSWLLTLPLRGSMVRLGVHRT
jgi:peptidoglycan/LPS O-acetylase OafA/YrhL